MRMKMIVAGALIGAILATGLYVRRQKYVVQTHKISEGVYVFCASGMNTLAVIADDGVILVDTMKDGWWGRALETALREVTDKQVTTIINTNSHPPHSGNNFRFAKDGVVIIAHERTKSRLQGRDNFQGAGARHLPQTTFRDRLTLMRGKERIELYHFGAANTDGDAWVVFPSRRIMHVGDLVKIDEMPEITPVAGGSGVSYAQTIGRAMATIKDVDLVVAGHIHEANVRPTLPWAKLGEYQRKAGVLVEAVRRAMQSVEGVDAVVSHVHAGALFSHYKAEDVTAAVRAIYVELTSARGSSREVGGK
jgi:cyclase